MSKTSHVEQPQALASRIDHRPSPSHPIEASRHACAWPESMATDWLRLRAIVDGLLCRAATARDVADAVAATTRTSRPQEAIHG